MQNAKLHEKDINTNTNDEAVVKLILSFKVKTHENGLF